MARREARGRPACWCRRHSLPSGCPSSGRRRISSWTASCSRDAVRLGCVIGVGGEHGARERTCASLLAVGSPTDGACVPAAAPPQPLVRTISNARTIDRGCVTVPMLDAAYFTRCEWSNLPVPAIEAVLARTRVVALVAQLTFLIALQILRRFDVLGAHPRWEVREVGGNDGRLRFRVGQPKGRDDRPRRLHQHEFAVGLTRKRLSRK